MQKTGYKSFVKGVAMQYIEGMLPLDSAIAAMDGIVNMIYAEAGLTP